MVLQRFSTELRSGLLVGGSPCLTKLGDFLLEKSLAQLGGMLGVVAVEIGPFFLVERFFGRWKQSFGEDVDVQLGCKGLLEKVKLCSSIMPNRDIGGDGGCLSNTLCGFDILLHMCPYHIILSVGVSVQGEGLLIGNDCSGPIECFVGTREGTTLLLQTVLH